MRIALLYLLLIVCFDAAFGAMETLCENMDVPDKEKMAREACHGMCLLHACEDDEKVETLGWYMKDFLLTTIKMLVIQKCGGGECVAHGGWKYCVCMSCRDFDNADMELERIVKAYWYY
ncbi:unnamed protein product [Nippostrongylus brasiliensis]|uniref:Saposin B-type domain-containing protein n=1 Tax=Nippostrongylus brasiliensis TaxID=27835 RepID=A0A0N4XFY8_NIPBR|nr:unnamed protein product [Nippostrongylus brasiliensis]